MIVMMLKGLLVLDQNASPLCTTTTAGGTTIINIAGGGNNSVKILGSKKNCRRESISRGN